MTPAGAAASIETLPDWLAHHYALASPVSCHLLRSYTNDVYVVEPAHSARYVLKVYGAGWKTEAQVRWEAGLLLHLSAAGAAVAVPIAGSDGDPVRTMPSPDGDRLAVLFSYAPGEKPLPPFTASLYEAFGRAIARMHALSDDYAPPGEPHPLDLKFLIDESLSTILPHIDDADERAYLEGLARSVRERIAALAAGGLDFGPIHGDASLDNLHVGVDGEAILYDFDLGGTGWRAADLQGWALDWPEWRERWEAFHRGYASVRSLCPSDLAAAPLLIVAQDIRGMKIDLDRRIAAQGREPVQAYLRDRLQAIRERAAAARPGGDPAIL